MERKDIQGFEPRHHMDPYQQSSDEVRLTGNGREAELIVAGLKALAAQVALRDITVRYSERRDSTYPSGFNSQGGGVPLAGEVEQLLSDIGEPIFASNKRK